MKTIGTRMLRRPSRRVSSSAAQTRQVDVEQQAGRRELAAAHRKSSAEPHIADAEAGRHEQPCQRSPDRQVIVHDDDVDFS